MTDDAHYAVKNTHSIIKPVINIKLKELYKDADLGPDQISQISKIKIIQLCKLTDFGMKKISSIADISINYFDIQDQIRKVFLMYHLIKFDIAIYQSTIQTVLDQSEIFTSRSKSDHLISYIIGDRMIRPAISMMEKLYLLDPTVYRSYRSDIQKCYKQLESYMIDQVDIFIDADVKFEKYDAYIEAVWSRYVDCIEQMLDIFSWLAKKYDLISDAISDKEIVAKSKCQYMLLESIYYPMVALAMSSYILQLSSDALPRLTDAIVDQLVSTIASYCRALGQLLARIDHSLPQEYIEYFKTLMQLDHLVDDIPASSKIVDQMIAGLK